jgi:hypothetical protein
MRRALVPVLFLSAACATTAANQQPAPRFEATEVELTLKDADASLVEQAQAAFTKVAELKSARLKSHAGSTAVFTVMYPGDVSDFPKTLARLPAPGLRFQSSKHAFEYQAFDNVPPTVAFLHPDHEQVLNAKEQYVTVDVPDNDVASVTVNGRSAPLYKGSVYRVRLELNEGQQELVAVAKDKAGNESSARVTVTVDTTAPALQAQIKLLVEGHVEPGSSVLIDGMEVAVDSAGNYRAEVPVRKGRRGVEIVAIDRSGNKTTTVKTLGE